MAERVEAVVVVLEQVEQEAEHLRRADSVRVPQPTHGQGDAALEEVVLEVAEVVLLDDVAGGEASENSLEDDEHGRQVACPNWPP